ncbi:hypothetical protein LINPERPRIM_LOCUS14719, partial [Linum perenne]
TSRSSPPLTPRIVKQNSLIGGASDDYRRALSLSFRFLLPSSNHHRSSVPNSSLFFTDSQHHRGSLSRPTARRLLISIPTRANPPTPLKFYSDLPRAPDFHKRRQKRSFS